MLPDTPSSRPLSAAACPWRGSREWGRSLRLSALEEVDRLEGRVIYGEEFVPGPFSDRCARPRHERIMHIWGPDEPAEVRAVFHGAPV